MIINLFTRTFLVSPDILRSNKDFIKYIDLKDIRIPKSLEPYEYFKQLLGKLEFDQSYIFLVPGGKKQFYSVLAKYCALLQINDSSMLNSLINWFRDSSALWIYMMHEFGTTYNASYYQPLAVLDMVSELKDYLTQYNGYNKELSYTKDETLLNAIPAEYFINADSNNKYKKKKFTSFLVYEIMELMFIYSMACFSVNMQLPKFYMDIQKEAIEKNIELKDCILEKYPGDSIFDLCKELKEYVNNFPATVPTLFGPESIEMIMDDRGVFNTKSLDEYINNKKSTRGYSDINIFKYNRYLEKAVRECRYCLPIKMDGDVE